MATGLVPGACGGVRCMPRCWPAGRGEAPAGSRDLRGQVLWYITGVKIARSARRHGVSGEAIRPAAANAVCVIGTGEGLFIIGADTAGRMPGLAGRPGEAGDLVVFCAMPLRPVNARRYLP